MKKFHHMREEFHPHETHVARLPVYSLGNCVMKLCIETSLKLVSVGGFIALFPRLLCHVK